MRRGAMTIWRSGFLLFLILAKSIPAGEYAADFLRIGVGARALAMGGAFTAVANDASAFYWNPAGMTAVNKFSVHVDHVALFGGLSQYNAVSATLGFRHKTAVAINWLRLGVDEIPRYGPLLGSRLDRLTNLSLRSNGTPDGFFSDTEDAVLLSFSRTEKLNIYLGAGLADDPLPAEVSFGLNAKFIRQNLDDAVGSGQGLDAGILLRLISESAFHRQPNTWLGFGVYFKDLSKTAIVWSTGSKHRDEISRGLQSGVAFSHRAIGIKSRLTLSFDKEFGFYSENHFGGEIEFFDVLAVRGGYYRDNFSTGAGLSLFGFRVDYAFIPHELENSHRISASMNF